MSGGEFGYSGAFAAHRRRRCRTPPGFRRAVDHKNSVRLVRPMIESIKLPACVQHFTAPRRAAIRFASCPIRP
ncbi:hypothetical protein AWB78_00135 [Caballeronia calidae]|uniref:Uncharacterized protein n=1 Tax=Caballeronia calidae TaxID=1777139 RepID=A0A157Z5L1_9BURK|nr:hypothetical protein AWB78_00135 [Caballeronia calidae]